jgi:energy-coupling factor transport system ATP-binding protein
MSLVARDLVYRYPSTGSDAGTDILTGLSLTVPSGRVVALCGAARTGRSTALALMAGLLAPQGGEAVVDDALAASLEARGRVGLLLQNADEALFGLTVREDVMFAPLQLGLSPQEATARAERALRTVGLEPQRFALRSPFSLSGGQRRRAAVAGLLAMEPSYVLLDEPFVGLDPQGRDEISAVVRSIATGGFTKRTGVLVALSTLEGALVLADELVILHGGRAVWTGTAAEYAASPPEVELWGLRQPPLVELARRLARQGWSMPAAGADTGAMAAAIAAHLQGARR